MLFYLLQKNTNMIKIGNSASNISVYTCQPKTRNELIYVITDQITREGHGCDLNNIDTSLIEDMNYLFAHSSFNSDISKWNMSNVKDTRGMFYFSKFNGDISEWDVSNIEDMNYMFGRSSFNKDISNWKINKNCDISYMFEHCDIEEEYKPKSLQQK